MESSSAQEQSSVDGCGVGPVKKLQERGFALNDIMVICYYSEAVKALKNFLKSQGIKVDEHSKVSRVETVGLALDIKTVDGSQGMEKLVVITMSITNGCNKDHLGLLRDLRRIKVSLSRAKVLRIGVAHRGIGQLGGISGGFGL
ncbi:uncharacterized protein LY89DRAFT_770516 [Mollisia scopiformis]|uniref:DNA2/NAM7 helicase-like C-terminal domain-containing protein n=1 Tax=Mollisia scopiformis TaxID=149040 RepID=A0A194XMB6_MOLSC|nr:uncharacterized protein LY89DRAFT_770516 [Mollisia scopiformis]KUJ21266.1 hypothetical protein LY89DRAFT_770516 [Mollisia scopiformis]